MSYGCVGDISNLTKHFNPNQVKVSLKENNSSKNVYLLNLRENNIWIEIIFEWKGFISWAKAPALYVTISIVTGGGRWGGLFLDLAIRAHIELRNVKVTLR